MAPWSGARGSRLVGGPGACSRAPRESRPIGQEPAGQRQRGDQRRETPLHPAARRGLGQVFALQQVPVGRGAVSRFGAFCLHARDDAPSERGLVDWPRLYKGRATIPDASQLEVVMRYHERTKHHFNRFAPGPGGLDWANQPDPFRRYADAPLTRLPILKADEEPLSPRYDSLYAPGAVASVPVSVRALSRLLEYALALSAWKQAGGTRWALRVNPSSGNLHPTEGYVLIGGIAELGGTPGLFHYAPAEHGLERRADCPPVLFARLMRGFPPQAFLVGLSSVYWREAWKYGERAFRYCQHDAGHAIGTLRIAAATLGWSARVLDDVADATLEALLGLDRDADFEGAERESAELLMAVWPGNVAPTTMDLELGAVRELARQRWYGKANRLSPEDPVPWEIIDTVAAASRKP